MRIKTLAALLAASSLIMASPASSAGAPRANPAAALSPSAAARASAPLAEESKVFDSGIMGAALVFGLGLIAGYLLYSVINDDEDDVPASA